MLRVRYNSKSVSGKLNKAMLEAEGDLKERLKDIAFDMSVGTPVLSGAFASSYSVGTSSDRNIRRVSSRDRPKTRELARYQGVARQLMYTDIESLDLLDTQASRVIFRNGAPHSGVVNRKYQIIGTVKDKNR